MTSHVAPGATRRTIAVQVEDIAIEDGSVPAPRIGAVVTLPLGFVDLPDSPDDAVTIRVPLELVSSTTVFAARPALTVDDHDAVWVVAGGVQAIPLVDMQWPEHLDVAALLDASRSES